MYFLTTSAFISEISGVTGVKWLHISSLSMEQHILSLCIIIDRTCINDETARQKVMEVLEQEFKGVEFAFATIQTEECGGNH
jgi:Co/Zn/Cd efflux system component